MGLQQGMKIFEKFSVRRRKNIMKVPSKRIACIKMISIKQREKQGKQQFTEDDLVYLTDVLKRNVKKIKVCSFKYF